MINQKVFVFSGSVSFNGNKAVPLRDLIQHWTDEINGLGYRIVSFQMPDSNQSTKYGIFICERDE